METLIKQRIEEAAKKYAWANDVKPLPTDKNTMIPIGEEVEKAVFFGAMFLLQNQWISVDKDLPDYEKDVFVRFISRFPNNPNEFEIGYCTRWRTKDETVKTDPKGFSVVGNMEITHWMEIPSLEGGEK